MTRLIGTIQIEVERRIGAYGTDGVWQDQTPCVQCDRRFCGPLNLFCVGAFNWRSDGRVTITASVQFGKGVRSSRQDEGERADGSVKVFTLYPLRAFSADVTGDVLIIDGRRYRVTSVEYWRSRIVHYVAEADLWDADVEARA